MCAMILIYMLFYDIFIYNYYMLSALRLYHYTVSSTLSPILQCSSNLLLLAAVPKAGDHDGMHVRTCSIRLPYVLDVQCATISYADSLTEQ